MKPNPSIEKSFKIFIVLLIFGFLSVPSAAAETIQEKLRRIRQEEQDGIPRKTLEKREEAVDKKPFVSKFSSGKNCGRDFDCFLKTAQTCSPARLRRTVVNQSVIAVEAQQWLEIQGIQRGHCALYLRHDHLKIQFTKWWQNNLRAKNLSDEDIQQQQQDANDKISGQVLDGRCYISRSQIVSLLERWAQGSLSYSIFSDGKIGGDLAGVQCEGPLFKAIEAKDGGCQDHNDGEILCSWRAGGLRQDAEEGQCRSSADCRRSAKAKYVDCVDSQCVERECRQDLDCPSSLGSLFRCEEGSCRDLHDAASLPSLDRCLQTPCEGCTLGHYKMQAILNKYLCVQCSIDEDCSAGYQCQSYRCVER